MSNKTKETFDALERILRRLDSVDSVWWNADSPHTSRQPEIGNYVSIQPSSAVNPADNVSHYQQWQFMIFYMSNDLAKHTQFVDELSEVLPCSVVSLYNQHRIVGWKPYTIVRFITFGNLSSYEADPDFTGGGIRPI